jgi:hypothetical protein
MSEKNELSRNPCQLEHQPIADRIADILLEDHMSLMAEIEQLRGQVALLREALETLWVGTDPSEWDEKAVEMFNAVLAATEVLK